MSIGGFGEGWGGWPGCFPRRGATAARTARRRPCCGGGIGVWRGLGAARRSGGAKGGVGAGGGGLEGWTHGGVKLAGVEEEGRWCSGCLERET